MAAADAGTFVRSSEQVVRSVTRLVVCQGFARMAAKLNPALKYLINAACWIEETASALDRTALDCQLRTYTCLRDHDTSADDIQGWSNSRKGDFVIESAIVRVSRSGWIAYAAGCAPTGVVCVPFSPFRTAIEPAKFYAQAESVWWARHHKEEYRERHSSLRDALIAACQHPAP